MSITFAGLTKAAPKKAKQEKPILPDPRGTLVPLVAQGITAKQQVAAQEGVITQCNAALGEAAFRHAAEVYQRPSAVVEDTFQIGTAAGKAIVSLKNAYKLPEDLAPVREALGQHADVLVDSFTIEIDADAIPPLVQQTFVDELIKLAQSLDAVTGSEEVFKAITVRQRTKVAKAFHESRWALFPPEHNAKLHRLMPCVVSVRYDY